MDKKYPLNWLKTQKSFGGVLPEKEINKEIVNRVDLLYVETGRNNENAGFKKALEKVFELVRYANKYFDEQQPWKQVHENPEACKQTLADSIYIIANLANILSPFLPFSSEKVKSMLQIAEHSWVPIEVKSIGLNHVEPLFERLDPDLIIHELEELKRRENV
jgi:methionyl-tRNA synthetase